MNQHTEPCGQCPWRKTSAPGWLGASTPLQFVQQAESGIKMPCHCAVDYEQDDWEDQIEDAPRCAGHAAYLRNRCKRPDEQELREFSELVGRRDDVFTRPEEFVAHHGGDTSRVMMVILGIDDASNEKMEKGSG
ncbi:hypothetical protein CPT_Summit_131 [Stenotrophomonas phage Summit]|nr:hypothetical protein CPT_Summit_131 [Stenotrophomonas phage Summit]